MSQRYRTTLLLGGFAICHVLASILAVAVAPTHKRVVGFLAVMCPFVVLTVSNWGQTAVTFDPVTDVLVPLAMAIPAAACTVLVIRKLERRSAAGR